MIYAFHDCVLDTALYTLTRAGKVTRLRPKVFQVLQYLLDNREQVVSKHDLLEAVWPDQYITETTLESTLSLSAGVSDGVIRNSRRVNSEMGYSGVCW